MQRARILRATAVLLLVSVSGCSGDAPEPVDRGDSDRAIITDPTDYSRMASGAQDGSHVHDYWDGQDVKQVWHGAVELRADGVPGATCEPLVLSSQACVAVHLPEAVTIIPGTDRVNITASWIRVGARDAGELRLDWSSAVPGNESKNLAVESGVPLSIESDERMNDPPHSTVSRWVFAFHIAGPVGSGIDAEISIDIVRVPGQLPAAPPHPDFYANATEVVLANSQGMLRSYAGAAPPGLPWGEPPMFPNFTGVPIVPPFTGDLKIRLWYNSTTPVVAHYDPRLSWHGADRRTGWEGEDVAPTTRLRQSADGFFEWVIPVGPKTWDSPYATTSGWELEIPWSGELVAGPLWVGIGPAVMDGDFHFQIVAELESNLP